MTRRRLTGASILLLVLAMQHIPAGVAESLPTATVRPTEVPTATWEPTGTPTDAPTASPTVTFTPEPTATPEAWPAGVADWRRLLERNGNRVGIDPALLAGLVQEESGGDSDLVSSQGACGLMQVMSRDRVTAPPWYTEDRARAFVAMFADRPTCAELQDPAFNVRWGVDYLVDRIVLRGSVREGLRSYGPRCNPDTCDIYWYADRIIDWCRRLGGQYCESVG